MKKRMRVFAGPNGSGKSTLTAIIKEKFKLGVYVNADELKVIILEKLRLSFSGFHIVVNEACFLDAIKNTSFDAVDNTENWRFEDNGLTFLDINSVSDYFIAFLADFIRQQLLDQCDRFSFETVMSHPSKLDIMKHAKEKGFKVYLYFVSLQDPALNVLRVKTRVNQGGHDVEEEKIISRYGRTMDQLFEAIKNADSAYIFDNSGSEFKLIAQKEEGILTAKVDYAPPWYRKYVLDKI